MRDAGRTMTVPTMTARKVFSVELGRFFVQLRESTGEGKRRWTQRQAAQIADNRGLSALTKGTLWRLEAGKIKHPSAQVLHDVAALYRRPYDVIVREVVRIVYDIAPSHASNSTETAPVGDDATFAESPTYAVNQPSAYRLESNDPVLVGLQSIIDQTLEVVAAYRSSASKSHRKSATTAVKKPSKGAGPRYRP